MAVEGRSLDNAQRILNDNVSQVGLTVQTVKCFDIVCRSFRFVCLVNLFYFDLKEEKDTVV